MSLVPLWSSRQWATSAFRLPRDAQLRELRPDLLEGRDDLVRRCKHDELAGIAGAVLQQGRLRIAAGVDLDGVDRGTRILDVFAGSGAAGGPHPVVYLSGCVDPVP